MWTYEQSTGKLYNQLGAHVATGYAGGGGGKHPEAVNNPSMQDQKGIGPLPQGEYVFGEPVPHSKLGPFAIPLIPNADNEMFGRGGFYCHGDNFNMNESASDGCIIMPRAVRNEMWDGGDHSLKVVAVYEPA